MRLCGVDIGGSGIKGAIVDVEMGELLTDRVRIATPQPAEPAAVVETVAEVVRVLGWDGPVGCAFPAVVRQGQVWTAANVSKKWIGVDGEAALAAALSTEVRLVNDADAAGMAELRFGAGRGVRGVVVMLTFGTGIGSAIFVDGVLVPNTEFGHLLMDGVPAEDLAAAKVYEEQNLSWDEWVGRVDRYIDYLESLLWPDLVVVGGGISKRAEKWVPRISSRAKVVPAQLRNNAGIVGAALAMAERT